MSRRPFSILLLACFAFWASGAALYAHESLEHSEAFNTTVAQATDESALSGAPDHAARPTGENHHRPHHDHDNCPVCQALASMKADRACAPAPLESHRPLVTTLSFPDRRPPVVFSLPSAPIRGPPEA